MLTSKKITLLSLSMLSIISATVHAETNQKQIIVAPKCLIKKLNSHTNYKILSSNSSLVLIETTRKGIEQFIAAKHKRSAKPCGGFMDATDTWNAKNTSHNYAKTFLKSYDDSQIKFLGAKVDYKIQYSDQVNAMMKQLNPQLMWDDLAQFSNTQKDQFPDRYADSDTGVKAAKWLQEKILTIAKENNRNDITTYTVKTGYRYKQPSVVVKIGDSNEPGIVIGGHMDTVSSKGDDSWPPRPAEVKPGADDDGSGSMTVMGIARTLINSGVHFKKPIYIIWYSAEEEGAIGSGYVAREFVKKKIPVDAVLQFDMTGYAHQNSPKMWLITDHVNPGLTDYIETLITTYIRQEVGRSQCGYSCSDHASWTKAGFKSAFPIEAKFGEEDPYLHTAQDTMDLLSLKHMTNFAKLGLAFAVEMAEPIA